MSFLQSGAWEKFQQSVGRKTWRVEGRLVIRHVLPGGFNYLYSPRPVSVTDEWLRGVQKIADEEWSIFLKIDPLLKVNIQNLKFRTSISVQPRKTLIIDVQKSEDDLFADMHPKTRYNIRLAERHGVRISRGKDIEKFWDLLKETSGRDKFHVHDRGHYEKLFNARDPEFSNELFFAEYEDKAIAAAIVNFYAPLKTATYLHGASSTENRAVMAPYLLHWSILQEAKKRGLKYYDLWGIDEKRWPGFTRFKLGFGGRRFEYPESVDIIYRSALYKIYWVLRRLRN